MEEAKNTNGQITSLAIGVDDKLSVWENILYGLQHVFVLMLAPLITPIIFASVFQWDINLTAYLVMIMIVGAGLETLIQTRVLKLPVAQAQHIVFIAAMIPAIFALGPIPVWFALVIVSAVTLLLVIPFKKGLVGKLAYCFGKYLNNVFAICHGSSKFALSVIIRIIYI